MSKYNTTEFKELAISYIEAIKKSRTSEVYKEKVEELLSQPADFIKDMLEIGFNPFKAMVETSLEQEAITLFDKVQEFGRPNGFDCVKGLPFVILKNLTNLAKHIINNKPEFIDAHSLEAATHSKNLGMLEFLLDKKDDFTTHNIKYVAEMAIGYTDLDGFKLLLEKYPGTAEKYGGDLYFKALYNNGFTKNTSKIGYLEAIEKFNKDAYKTSTSFNGKDALHNSLAHQNISEIGLKDLVFVITRHPDLLNISDSNGHLPFDILCNTIKKDGDNNHNTLSNLKDEMSRCSFAPLLADKIFNTNAKYTGIDYLLEIGNKKAAATALIKKIGAQIKEYKDLNKSKDDYLADYKVIDLTQLFKLDTTDFTESYNCKTKFSRGKIVDKLKPLFSQNFKTLCNLVNDTAVDNELAKYIIKGCNMLATNYQTELSDLMNEAATSLISKAFDASGDDALKSLVLYGRVTEEAKDVTCDAIIASHVKNWLEGDAKNYFTSNGICKNLQETPIGSIFAIEEMSYEIISYLVPNFPNVEAQIQEVSIAGDAIHEGA